MITLYMNDFPNLDIGYDGNLEQFFLYKDHQKIWFHNLQSLHQYFLDRNYTQDYIDKLRLNLKRAFDMLNFFHQFPEEEIYDKN